MNKFKCRANKDEVKFRLREIDEESVVENYPAEMQNINEHGFIRNDISQIMLAQMPQDLDYILNRISLAKKESKFSGMSDKDILLTIKPRLLQSPAEIEKYLQYLDENMSDVEKQIIAEKEKENPSIKFNENETPDENS